MAGHYGSLPLRPGRRAWPRDTRLPLAPQPRRPGPGVLPAPAHRPRRRRRRAAGRGAALASAQRPAPGVPSSPPAYAAHGPGGCDPPGYRAVSGRAGACRLEPDAPGVARAVQGGSFLGLAPTPAKPCVVARASRPRVAPDAGQGVIDEAEVDHAVEVQVAGQL